MARKAHAVGPNFLALVEDARIDLARAALAIREGENEPDFQLSEAVPDPSVLNRPPHENPGLL